MALELEQEKVDLIKKFIKSDRKYTDNEDLFDDFFNETYKRSFVIIKTVKKESAVEAYLKKIVNTSIISVLKNSGRIKRTSEGFVPSKEESLDEIISTQVSKYSNFKVNYDIIDLDDGPEEIVIKKEVLQTFIDAITIAHNSSPTKQYLQLYNLRYVKGLKQKQIAHELNLSQSEVSKRLIELMDAVKKTFNKV